MGGEEFVAVLEEELGFGGDGAVVAVVALGDHFDDGEFGGIAGGEGVDEVLEGEIEVGGGFVGEEDGIGGVGVAGGELVGDFGAELGGGLEVGGVGGCAETMGAGVLGGAGFAFGGGGAACVVSAGTGGEVGLVVAHKRGTFLGLRRACCKTKGPGR